MQGHAKQQRSGSGQGTLASRDRLTQGLASQRDIAARKGGDSILKVDSTLVMPTIHRERNFRVVISPNDNEPSHVHVLHPDGEVRIDLGSATEMPSIMTVEERIKNKDVVRALEIASSGLAYKVGRDSWLIWK